MSVTNRRRAPLDPNTALLLFLGVPALIAAGIVWAAMAAGYALAARPLPPNPIKVVGGLITGGLPWLPECTWALLAGGLPLLAAAAAVVVVVLRVRAGRPAIDKAAPFLGHGRAVRPLTAKTARRKAARLGVDGFIGLPIGPTVADGQDLIVDVEGVRVTFAGPRTGKTTAAVIPNIMAAPGWVVATGNKRDVPDATREPRAARGRVWVFDPMSIVGEPCGWYWNPLTYVHDETTAQRLAGLFASASRPPGATRDGYFDPKGETLLSNLLLAAALSGRALSEVYTWATTHNDDEPARLLDRASPGVPGRYALPAKAVRGVIDAPSKERGGIYGSAERSLSFLLNHAALHWVQGGGPGEHRHQFDPHAFVRSTDTLYLLSREGVGSTAPLVLALTAAVTEAAEAFAQLSPHGRLPTPGVIELDEAANIVAWPQLPDLYSHYGSKGLLMHTVLQSPAQAVAVWGKDGLAKLVAAANVLTYGGGVRDTEFLHQLSQLIGPDRYITASSSTSAKSGWSMSRGESTESALDVQDLADLDPARWLVFGHGMPATLARKVSWRDGPHAKAIQASIDLHDPGATGPRQPADRPVESDVPSAAQVRTTSPWQAHR